MHIGNISVSLYVTLKTNADVFSICSSGENSDLSAQNALDLLLNMSNARELVGNALQVGGSSKTALHTVTVCGNATQSKTWLIAFP